MRNRYGARLRFATARLALVFSLSLSVLSIGCRAERSDSSSKRSDGAPSEWFTERAQESGLDFVHFNGMSGRFLYPELMAPGVALFDYDNDGDLDVFIVQGRMLGKTSLDGYSETIWRSTRMVRGRCGSLT
jgi:hypothetical protein